MPPLDDLVPGLVGLSLCVAGAGWATWQVVQSWLARGWATAEGTVTSSRVQHRRQRNGVSARLHVEYRFFVGAREHLGTRVFFAEGLQGNAAACAEVVQRYPAGARVTVLHAPGDPTRSCLEPRAALLSWLMAAFCWGMAVYPCFYES